jgi:hypothetical protein
MPDSASCSISSPWTRPFIRICPSAVTIRSMPSAPRLSPDAAFPTAVRVPFTEFAANPNARRCCACLATSPNSNGVSLANVCSIAIMLRALAADPSMVSIETDTCCMLAADFTA